MRAAGEVSRRGRTREAACVSRLGVLGQSCAGIWRSEGAAFCFGVGAGSAWCKSYGTCLHWRSQRGFFVCGVAQSGICESSYFAATRRWIEIEKRVHRSGSSVRSSCEQTSAQRNPQLSTLSGKGTGNLAAASRTCARENCVGRVLGSLEATREGRLSCEICLRTWGGRTTCE